MRLYNKGFIKDNEKHSEGNSFSIIASGILLFSMIILIGVVHYTSIEMTGSESSYLDMDKEENRLAHDNISSEVAMLQGKKSDMEMDVKRLSEIAGKRQQIISELNHKLSQEGLDVEIDEKTGEIRFAEGLFFGVDRDQISGEGRSFLDRFMPIYLSVLFSDSNKQYVEGVIISGYADDRGSYLYNLELSQKRAMSVMNYIFQKKLYSIANVENPEACFTIAGRSFSEMVQNTDQVDQGMSRRVGFQFQLKEEDLINEMEKIVEEYGQ